MPVRKHSVEQIIAKLREIEKLTAQGMSVPMAARKVGVTDQTFYCWRIQYAALNEAEASAAAARVPKSHVADSNYPPRVRMLS